MPLHEFDAAFKVHPDTRDVVTVSGYVLHLLGRLPEKGATVGMGEWRGTIETLDGRKVKTLRLRKTAGAPRGSE